MKKILIALAVLISLNANANEEEFSKKGFLASKWCVVNGYFKDCRLESFVCGDGECFKTWDFGDKVTDDLVLYVHDEGRYYNIDPHSLHRYELDEAVVRNEVEIIGEYDKNTNTIKASKFKAPPPPKKSFFKGCL